MNSSAIYAGTFDPLTLGHLDVIERASALFGVLTVAVAENPRKQPFFTLEERLGILRESLADRRNIEVEAFDGLLVEYARRKGVRVLVRGLRAISDFEFEFQMALMNRKMRPEIETVFLMPKDEFSYLTSSSVREIESLGGPIEQFLPAASVRAFTRRRAP
jgi:pantetheine-phosphate adenylyltransferase